MNQCKGNAKSRDLNGDLMHAGEHHGSQRIAHNVSIIPGLRKDDSPSDNSVHVLHRRRINPARRSGDRAIHNDAEFLGWSCPDTHHNTDISGILADMV